MQLLFLAVQNQSVRVNCIKLVSQQKGNNVHYFGIWFRGLEQCSVNLAGLKWFPSTPEAITHNRFHDIIPNQSVICLNLAYKHYSRQLLCFIKTSEQLDTAAMYCEIVFIFFFFPPILHVRCKVRLYIYIILLYSFFLFYSLHFLLTQTNQL